MSSIKSLVFALLCIILLEACSPFKMQIVSLENEKIPKNDTLWTLKDSLVDIVFDFYSDFGKTSFTAVNHNNYPIFIDLKNSFVWVNDDKLNLWKDEAAVKSEVSLITTGNNSYVSFTRGEINGTIVKPDRIIMVPPKSNCQIKTEVMLQKIVYNLKKVRHKTDTVKSNWTLNKTARVKTFDYTKTNSPTKARIFIAACRYEEFKNPSYYDLNFWVSSIQEMEVRQATGHPKSIKYLTGAYSLNDSLELKKIHPYKKAWRFYIPEEKQE